MWLLPLFLLAATPETAPQNPAPATAQAPLSPSLDQILLPEIKLDKVSLAAALQVWRDAVLKAESKKAPLALLLPSVETPQQSLVLPAGKAADGLADLLQAYACECRIRGELITVATSGSAFADDGPWIPAAYHYPRMLDNEEITQDQILAFCHRQHIGLSAGSVLSYQDSILSCLLQEEDLRRLQEQMNSTLAAPRQIRLDSLWLRIPGSQPEKALSLAAALAKPGVEILSRQSLLLENQKRGATGCGAVLVPAEGDSPEELQDVFTATPNLDADDDNLMLEFKHSLGWPGKDGKIIRYCDEQQLNLRGSETRLTLQEAEADGQHLRLHFLISHAEEARNPPSRILPPLSDLKVLGIDDKLAARLNLGCSDESDLVTALQHWAMREKIELHWGGKAPDAFSGAYRSLGSIPAAALLRELCFRSQIQARWLNQRLELSWPPSQRHYSVRRGFATQVKQSDDQSLADFLLAHLPAGFEVDYDRIGRQLKTSAPTPQLDGLLRLICEERNATPSITCQVDIVEAPVAELMKLEATQSKLRAAELFTAVTRLPGCRSLRQLSSDFLNGSTKSIEPETAKVEAKAAARTALGWLIEITPMVEPNESSVQLECRIYENAPPRQTHIEATCQGRLGDTLLLGRSSVPATAPGQASTSERLVFLRLLAAPRKPVLEELP